MYLRNGQRQHGLQACCFAEARLAEDNQSTVLRKLSLQVSFVLLKVRQVRLVRCARRLPADVDKVCCPTVKPCNLSTSFLENFKRGRRTRNHLCKCGQCQELSQSCKATQAEPQYSSQDSDTVYRSVELSFRHQDIRYVLCMLCSAVPCRIHLESET